MMAIQLHRHCRHLTKTYSRVTFPGQRKQLNQETELLESLLPKVELCKSLCSKRKLVEKSADVLEAFNQVNKKPFVMTPA